MVEVNEGDTPDILISFYNNSEELTAPTTASWLLMDVDTGTELIASTDISPIASSVVVSIPATGTTILNDSRKFEKRKMIVNATFGAGRKKFGEYIFQVKNLVEG